MTTNVFPTCQAPRNMRGLLLSESFQRNNSASTFLSIIICTPYDIIYLQIIILTALFLGQMMTCSCHPVKRKIGHRIGIVHYIIIRQLLLYLPGVIWRQNSFSQPSVKSGKYFRCPKTINHGGKIGKIRNQWTEPLFPGLSTSPSTGSG